MTCKPNTMKREAPHPIARESGPVWQRIGAEARELAAREPMFAGLLSTVTVASSAEDLLVSVLAARLAEAGADRNLFVETLRSGANCDVLLATEADINAVVERDPACPGPLHVLMNLKGFQALQTYRFANSLWRDGRRESARLLSSQASLVFGLDIHPAARIGCGVMLDHGSGIVIGETAVVENDVSILQNVTLGGTGKQTGDRHPKIRRGVMIGAGAKVLGNIEVGAYSKVAAGSVVLGTVPPHTTVAGVPAAVVRRHGPDEVPSATMDQRID